MWLLTKYKNINQYLESPLIPFLVALIIALYNIRIGISLSPDSHRYIAAANGLINLDFNYFLFFDNYQLERFFPVIFPISLIALLKTIFPLAWMHFFISINILFVFITIFFLQKAMLSLKINNVVATICISTLLFSVDYLTWPRFILTDTIYTSLSFLLIYLTLAIRNVNFSKISIWLLCFILLALTRQVCIPILAVSMLLMLTHKIKLNGKVMLILLFTLFLASAFLFSITLTTLSNKIILPYSPQVIDYINFAKSGVIIHHRPETYITISYDIFGFFKLFCYRFFHFFNPYATSFSSVHILFNSLISMIYFLGLTTPIWTWTHMTNMQKQYFIKLNLFICAIAIFHSATLIDFDWRYRFPDIILMVLVGAISLHSMVIKSTLFRFNQN